MASREAPTQHTSHNVVTSSQTAERVNMGYNNHQSKQISGNISPKQSTLSDNERRNNGINNLNAAVNASLSLAVTSQSRKAERTQEHDKTKDQLMATKEETQQLRETSVCKICLEDPANIVFLPCGHVVACGVCSPALERCPVCRTHIRGTVRVHFADMASREAPTQHTSHNVVTSSQTAERANMGYNNHQSKQISGNISPKQSTLSDNERRNNGINNSNAAVNASLSLAVTSQSRKAERTQEHDKTKDQLMATKEETQQLRESSTCKICLENPANIVFLSCGHVVACGVCSPALERCPVCRKHIRGIVRAHLADMAFREKHISTI